MNSNYQTGDRVISDIAPEDKDQALAYEVAMVSAYNYVHQMLSEKISVDNY